MSDPDRVTRSNPVSKDVRDETSQPKELVVEIKSKVRESTTCQLSETNAHTRLEEIFNFIEKELDPGKKLLVKGKTVLKEKLTKWVLDQANLEGQIKILKEENETLKRQIQNQNRSSVQVSYASVASAPTAKQNNLRSKIQKQVQKENNVIFITSENESSGKKIQEEFTKLINPRTNKLKINKMRTTPRSLIVETATKEDLEKITNNTQVRRQFKCELPKKRNPLVIIYDVPTRFQDEELKDMIYKQNFDSMTIEEFDTAFKLRFKTGPKGKATSHVVAEVKPDLRKKILSNRIYVEFSCLSVKDYLVVPKCLKCLDLGHVSKHCSKTNTACAHCGESHEKKDCTKLEEPRVCIPCKSRNKKCAKDKKDCPTHKLLMERLIQKTDYGQ